MIRALLVLASCAPTPLALDAVVGAAHVELRANGPVTEVVVTRADGLVALRRRLPAASTTVLLPLPPGEYEVRAADAAGSAATASLLVPDQPPVEVAVQVAPGAPWRPLAGDVEVPIPQDALAEVLVAITAGPGHPAELHTSLGTISLPAVGTRIVRAITVRSNPLAVHVGDAAGRLVPEPYDPSTLAASFRIGTPVFPAAADGSADLARPAWRVSLPVGVLSRALAALGFGGRRRDDQAPWAYTRFDLSNTSARDLDVVARLRVQTPDGAMAPAFRPRVREADGGTGVVTALVRVPAGGTARVTMPVYVDTSAVTQGLYHVSVTTTPLGSDVSIGARQDTLLVRGEDPVAANGFVAACVIASTGAAWAAGRLRGWLDRSSTAELMAIALLGAAAYVAGTAADLVALATSAALGPFAPFVTSLLADVPRTALCAALLALQPRPGTLTLALVTAALLRGFTMGAFAPADLLYLGLNIALAEGFAAAAGLTRAEWRDEPIARRALRLAAAFGAWDGTAALCGVWIHVVLFRLDFATWYIATTALGPGLLYGAVAGALSAGFAARVRASAP